MGTFQAQGTGLANSNGQSVVIKSVIRNRLGLGNCETDRARKRLCSPQANHPDLVQTDLLKAEGI